LISKAPALAKAAFDDLRSDDEDDAIEVPVTRLNARISAHRVWDDVRCTLAELKPARKAVEGATINDVCLAIVAGGMRRYLKAKRDLPETTLWTVVPISTRTPEQAKDCGNQLSLMRTPLHTEIADPKKRLAAIVKDTRDKKAMQKGVAVSVLLDVVQNLPGALVGLAARAVPFADPPAVTNTMVTNVPGPNVPYYFLGAKNVRSTDCMPMMDGGGVLHSVCSVNGEFTFTFTGCRDLLPDPAFYRECLKASVDEVVAIGRS
jgi:WS/DGAT/MGAT family acyltransferase